MSPKVKFYLMSFFSLAGLVGFVALLCNTASIVAAASNVAGYWIGLIAVIALFEILLFFSVGAGMKAFSSQTEALKTTDDAVKNTSEDEEEMSMVCREETDEQPEQEEETAPEEEERSAEEERARMAAILAVAEEDDEESEEEENDESDEEKEDDVVVTDAATGLKIVVHYRRSFMARLIQSQDKIQDYYTGLKNVLLSFEGVKSRVSWNYDSFNRGRKQLAKMNIRGKSLMLYLALDPKEFEETKYFFTDVSDKLKFSKVPMRIKIRSGRGFKHGVELIEEMMNRMGIVRQEVYHPVDFHMPYETTQQLIGRGLIKVITPEEEEKVDASFVMENLADFIRDEITVAEADALVSDDAVKMAVKHVVRERPSNKKTYINLDTICDNFEDGATVNLIALKEKKLIPADIGRIKILARGSMTKQMTIEADDFSVQAIKMIVLTGGEAVKVD